MKRSDYITDRSCADAATDFWNLSKYRPVGSGMILLASLRVDANIKERLCSSSTGIVHIIDIIGNGPSIGS
ncbi:hypothetical protein [Halobacillus salinus]|uniref:hypothetical protein n=1 Tax=Halobacillus salinus TaxID=192814 RepID=UPI00111669CD|nr:hypothetical protein [Halobacillus salinus]